MAAKGSKPRRGRKAQAQAGDEPEREPESGPDEAQSPPQDEIAAAPPESFNAGPEEAFFAQEPVEAEAAFELHDRVGRSEPIQSSEPSKPKERADWQASHLIVGGLAVVLVLAALAGVLMYATAGDPARLDHQTQRLEAIAEQVQTQASQIGAAEEAIAALRSDVGEVTTAVTQLQGSLGELQTVAEANRRTLDGIAGDIGDLRGVVEAPADGAAAGELQDTIATLDERLTGLEQANDLGEFTGMVAGLREEVAELRRQAAERIGQVEAASALGRSFAALSERIAAGAPFADELEAVTAELPGAPGLEVLRPYAAQGVATMADLQERLAGIASGLPRGEAQEAPAAEGFWQTMGQRLESMVTVRRADEADRPSVLARAEEALQRGDIEAAIADVERLGDGASGEHDRWLADARAHRDAQAALDELSDAVLRQFAGRG